MCADVSAYLAELSRNQGHETNFNKYKQNEPVALEHLKAVLGPDYGLLLLWQGDLAN